jgi:hypothetical protein
MNFKAIRRRIEKLTTASEAPVAYQPEDVLRHWRETGELSYSDGSRFSVEVFRQVMACLRDEPDPVPPSG